MSLLLVLLLCTYAVVAIIETSVLKEFISPSRSGKIAEVTGHLAEKFLNRLERKSKKFQVKVDDVDELIDIYTNEGICVSILLELATTAYVKRKTRLPHGKELFLYSHGLIPLNYGKCMANGGYFRAKLLKKEVVKIVEEGGSNGAGVTEFHLPKVTPAKVVTKDGVPLMVFKLPSYPNFAFYRGNWRLVNDKGEWVPDYFDERSGTTFSIGKMFNFLWGVAFVLHVNRPGTAPYAVLFSEKGVRWVFKIPGKVYTMKVGIMTYRVELDKRGILDVTSVVDWVYNKVMVKSWFNNPPFE